MRGPGHGQGQGNLIKRTASVRYTSRAPPCLHKHVYASALIDASCRQQQREALACQGFPLTRRWREPRCPCPCPPPRAPPARPPLFSPPLLPPPHLRGLGSPARSWDWGPVHFVALNLYPGDYYHQAAEWMHGSWKEPEGAFSFLQDDLRRNVGASQRPVVLYHHYGMDPGWCAGGGTGWGWGEVGVGWRGLWWPGCVWGRACIVSAGWRWPVLHSQRRGQM